MNPASIASDRRARLLAHLAESSSICSRASIHEHLLPFALEIKHENLETKSEGRRRRAKKPSLSV